MQNFLKNNLYTFYVLIGTICLHFFYRGYVADKLGAEYVGLIGLITSIIAFLQLAEAGIGQASIHFFFKPLKEQNYKEISKIIFALRKIYRFIFILTLIAALIIYIFFYNFYENLKNLEYASEIFLISALSVLPLYALGYSKYLLIADHKNYKVQKIALISLFIDVPLRISFLSLVETPVGLILAVLAMTTTKLLEGILINYTVNNNYKIKYSYPKINTTSNYFNSINFKNTIIGSSFHKLGDFAINNAPIIIIASLMPISLVGILSNYQLITFYILHGVTLGLSNLIAPMGSIFSNGDKSKSKVIFETIIMCSFILSGIICIIFIASINDFINVWLGAEYLLNEFSVYLIVFGLYLRLNSAALLAAKTAFGIFYPDRWSPIIHGIVVIGFTFYLVPKYGLNGVLVATIIGAIFVRAWHTPWIIYNIRSMGSSKNYFVKLIFGFILTMFTCIIYNYLLVYAYSYLLQLALILTCLASFIILSLLFFSQYSEFNFLRSFIANKFNKKT